MTTDRRDHVWERSDVGITDRRSQVGGGGEEGEKKKNLTGEE